MASRWMMSLLAASAMGLRAADALAQATTQAAVRTADPMLLSIESWAKFGCIFAGVAMLLVLMTRRHMKSLAQNQIELAKMIRELKK